MIFAVYFLTSLLGLGMLAKETAATTKPNIIFVMADDMGWGEPGAYPAGSIHGRIATPNLDNLAASGVKFTNAYAGYTVCAPSRTTLFTGRHSGKFHKYNLPGTSLSPGQALTTAEVLKKAGYATALIGKSAPLTNPLQQGFDHFIGQVDQSKCHNMYPKVIDFGNETGNVNLTLNWKPKSRALCMSNPNEYNYTTDLFQFHAMNWLEHAASNKNVPFFLYLSFTVPHAGGWSDLNFEQGAPVPTDGRYANETSWPPVERDHAGVITYLDTYVGQIMNQMKELNIEEDTILFFASDNGAHKEGGHSYTFFNSTGGLRGHKRSMYEGGMRSPTMVQWKGTIDEGRISDYPWSFWDIMPTFAELAGVSNIVPNDIDGHSIVPTLKGSTNQSLPPYIFYTGESQWGSGKGGKGITAYSIRMNHWKGVVNNCNNGVPSMKDEMQLFNLLNDPFEQNDISKKHENQIQKMKTVVVNSGSSCYCYQCTEKKINAMLPVKIK